MTLVLYQEKRKWNKVRTFGWSGIRANDLWFTQGCQLLGFARRESGKYTEIFYIIYLHNTTRAQRSGVAVYSFKKLYYFNFGLVLSPETHLFYIVGHFCRPSWIFDFTPALKKHIRNSWRGRSQEPQIKFQNLWWLSCGPGPSMGQD